MQLFSESCQFAFFPGDPGEDEYEFKQNWGLDTEPVAATIDKWSTNIVNIKKVSKVSHEEEEDNQTERSLKSSQKSKRPLSVTSKRSLMRRTNQTHMNKDLDTKSRIENQSTTEKKENIMNNINISMSAQSTQQKLHPQIPLDVAPPRVIGEEEKLLRDKKDKQLKVKELEAKEQREKEEREKLRQKSRLDAQAELEKHEYTYDDNGQIIFVKKPNLQKLQTAQMQKPEYQLNEELMQINIQKQAPIKQIRIKSAKVEMKRASQLTNRLSQEKIVESELEIKAQKEVQENYLKIFGPKQDASHDYGSALENVEVQAGIILNKENQRMVGPPIPRDRMTLLEYQKISQEFDFGSERMKKYDSQQKLLKPVLSSEIEVIEDNDDTDDGRRGFSGERLIKMPGAETVYDRELTVQEYKYMKKAQRKNLKSATAGKAYDQVIEKHNRITSAKAQDVRIRNNMSKKDLKEKIFNYENYIGGVDMPASVGVMSPSLFSGDKPLSGVQSNKVLNKDKSKPPKPVSVIDEYNKKILERGAERDINANDLPPVIKQHLLTKSTHQRPQTSKPVIQHNNLFQKKPLQSLILSDRDNGRFGPSGIQSDIILSTKNANKKLPRERVISAKVKTDQDKLPPPPFGKTMGHGLLAK